MDREKRGLIERYLSNTITADEAMRLKRLLSSEPDHEGEEDEVELLRKAYNTTSLITASPQRGDFMLGSRSLQEWKKRRRAERVRVLSLRWLTRVAGLLILLGLGYFISERRVYENLQKQVIEVEAPVGQSLRFAFSDGSTVRLSPCSRIRWDASFGCERREVTLEGAGFFEIAKDLDKPFVVSTERGFSVEVTGTEFFLQSDQLEALHLSLLQGAVRLHQKGVDSAALALKPGESVVLSDGVLVKQQEALSEIEYRKLGIVQFDSRPLSDILREIGYWYDLHVIYADPALRHRTLSGKFRQGDSLESIIEAICNSLYLRFEFIDRKSIRISERGESSGLARGVK